MMPQNPYANFNAQEFVQDATQQAKQRSMQGGSTAGSATGAILGSVIPGLGTVIGAGLGSVLGGGIGYLVGGRKARAEAQNEADAMLGFGQAQVQQGLEDMFEGQFQTAQQDRLFSMRRNVAPTGVGYLNFM
jgi:phage tail tape-measure protein